MNDRRRSFPRVRSAFIGVHRRPESDFELIQFRNFTLARGVRRLIEDLTLQIHAGWRVGLVGANGSGKSSLFAVLRGELHGDTGDCAIPASWRIGTVAQETPALAKPAIDYVLDGDTELREIMGRAVEDFVPFEEAYAKTDWSRYAKIPAFDAANRINAYGQYLVMERELLQKR